MFTDNAEIRAVCKSPGPRVNDSGPLHYDRTTPSVQPTTLKCSATFPDASFEKATDITRETGSPDPFTCPVSRTQGETGSPDLFTCPVSRTRGETGSPDLFTCPVSSIYWICLDGSWCSASWLPLVTRFSSVSYIRCLQSLRRGTRSLYWMSSVVLETMWLVPL